MDNILDMLNGEEKPFAGKEESAENTVSETAKKEEDKFDYWADPMVKPLKVDPSTFKVGSKSFMIATSTQTNLLSAEVIRELYELSKALVAKGYRFRHTGDATDKLQNQILEIEDIEVDSYLPWKKFHPEITNPTMKAPNGTGYRIAANSHMGFKKLSNAVRCILARNVNAMLGIKCTTPVTFIIAYSEDGAESITKGIDYKVTLNLAFFLKVAEDSNIPVFNIKKEGAVKRLIEYIQTKKD